MTIDLHHYIMILLGAVLVNNIVLVKILGLCPFMGVSKKLEASIGMAAATAFVLTIGSLTSWVITHYWLEPNHLEYLRTLSFIVVIAGVVQFTEMYMEKIRSTTLSNARHLFTAHHHQLCGFGHSIT